MSSCLKIGHRLLNGDQIISALVQYKLLEPLVGQVLLDDVIQTIPLSKQELFYSLIDSPDTPVPEDFEHFLVEWCHAQGITLEYFKAVTLRELQLQKFKHLRFADRVESEFLQLKSDLDQVEYSRIQVTDRSLAQELYFQLRDDGADFAQLAEHHSLGSERQTGGWVGPVPLSSLPSAIVTLFRSTPIHTIHSPVAVDDHLWIVRLEQFTSARLTETTRTNMINRLYEQWLHTQVRQVIDTPGAIAVQSTMAA